MKVAKRLESIRCPFLWGDDMDKRRFLLVKWDEVKKPASSGGLGIKSLVEMNASLQGKWLWWFFNEDVGIWRKIIAARWGDANRELLVGRLNRLHGYGLWRKILMGWDNFKDCTQWCVGKRNCINFWEDVWIDNLRLMETFPSIMLLLGPRVSKLMRLIRQLMVWSAGRLMYAEI